MIVKKDDLSFYADIKGNPDVLLYAPQNYIMIRDYIISNKIKKIALCGGGFPTQDYVDTISDFEWIEYINGYTKGLDFSFFNQMTELKTYIGTINFELTNKSVEELYIGTTAKTKISKLCSSLKILDVEGCKSVEKLFGDNFPPILNQLTFHKGMFENCVDFMPNISITDLSFVNCSKLKNLENLKVLEGLKKLKLDNCKNLSDISEIFLIPSLKELVIINCPNVDIKKQNVSNGLVISIY